MHLNRVVVGCSIVGRSNTYTFAEKLLPTARHFECIACAILEVLLFVLVTSLLKFLNALVISSMQHYFLTFNIMTQVTQVIFI